MTVSRKLKGTALVGGVALVLLILFQNAAPVGSPVATTPVCRTPSDLLPDPVTGLSKFKTEFASAKVTKTSEVDGRSYSYTYNLVRPLAPLTLCAGQVYEGFVFEFKKSRLTLDCAGATIKGQTHATLTKGSQRQIRSEGILIQSTWKSPVTDVTVKNCVIDKPNAVGLQVMSQPEFEKVEVNLGSKVSFRNTEYNLESTTWDGKPVQFIAVPYKLQVFTPSIATEKPYVMDAWITRLRSAGTLNEDGTEPAETQAVKQMFRDRGPKNILIENVTVNDAIGNAMNVHVGVTGVTIRRARFKNPQLGIYFSTGSFENRLENSEFITEPGFKTREFVAIDASAGNSIVDNSFKGNGSTGAIYLYKNCWEYHDKAGEPGGNPRTQASHGNLIARNRFENFSRAIWVASRQSLDQLNTHCGDVSPYRKNKDFYPYKADDEKRFFLDYASHNKIEGNQFAQTDIAIKVEDNFTTIANNKFLYDREAPGPVIQIGTPLRSLIGQPVKETILEGNIISGKKANFTNFVDIGFSSKNVHFNRNETGDLLPDGKPDFSQSRSVRSAHFVHKGITGSNAGLIFRFDCPAGEKVVGVKAICDLEAGQFSRDHFNHLESQLSSGEMEVRRTSSIKSEGKCSAGSTTLSEGRSSIPLSGSSSIEFACHEHDSNGGDCALAASIICERAGS